VAHIVARTDGVPLFAEELTKSVVEGGCELRDPGRSPAALLHAGVPARLQDPLLARLDRLGPAKSTAQLAAVCGREFTLDLLESVAPAGGTDVRQSLAQLMAAGLVYRRSDPARSVYTFRHALIHEAAYGSVLRETRRTWHARIAAELASQPGARENAPHELARHFEAGALPEQAIACYRDAAGRAVARSESVEALAYFRAAIDLIERLPPGEARDSLELALLLGQGQCAVALRGWGSVEAREAYQRARELCERVEEGPQVFLARRGVVTFYTSRCRLEDAHELARELVGQAERSGDVTLRLVARHQIAIVCFYLGDHADALRHYESALALHDPGVHDALTHIFGGHLGVFIRIWMAWALWTRGQPDRALECGLRAIVLARSSGHAFSLAYALLWIAILRLLRHEYGVARHLADEATTIATEQEFAFLRAIGRITHALAQLNGAPSEEDALDALGAFDSASKELPALMNQIGVPLIYAFLADVCLARDDASRAEQALAAAFAISESAPLPYWDAELLRLRACLLQIQEASPSDVERLLDESLAVARKQGALALELRTARTFAAWRYAHGAHTDATELLADVCGRFTEGFEGADLAPALRELDTYRKAAVPVAPGRPDRR
jgi:tetratricopeptide (TPR) repeat protein